jgi:intein-encoded DNA endonuclease-like protein
VETVANIIGNISVSPLYRILKEENAMEPGRRRYNINQDYFETIDTEEKAYWLGFLAADGTIRLRHGGAEKKKRGSSIVLKLAVKDEHHVDKFQKIFGIESRISYHRDYTKTRKGEVSFSDACRVSINSNKLIDDIIDKGVTPRKSQTLDRPNIKDEYQNHFIRGYFDGNGTITFNTKDAVKENHNVVKNFNIGFACFSDKFKEYLKEEIGKLNILLRDEPPYSLSIKNMKDGVVFINYIYKDATVFLERKKEISDRFIEHYNTKKELAMNEKFIGYKAYI